MKSKPISFNEVYQNNNNEQFIILEKVENTNKSHDNYVRVKFIKTGYEKIASIGNIRAGKVKDDTAVLRIGEVNYSLYYGPYTIVSYEGLDQSSEPLVRVKFHRTGYEKFLKSRYANENRPIDDTISKDLIQSTIDITPPNIYNTLINRNLKERWKAMMSRCYDPSCSKFLNYGKLGVRVHPIWHTFERFIDTIHEVTGFYDFYINPSKYQLDKDYKQFSKPKSERFYSPISCMFLSNIDNFNLSTIERDPDSINYNDPISYIMKRPATKLFGISAHPSVIDPNKIYYTVNLQYANVSYNLGVFTDIDAAITVYNNYYFMYVPFKIIPLINKHIYRSMDLDEALKYKA